MGAKAYKLAVFQLRKMCDVFGIDRSGAGKKDELCDILLDFLGEPNTNYIKGKKSKLPKYSGELKDNLEDDVEDEQIDGSVDPSDEVLRRWVRAYVRCHNMHKSTLKQAMEICSQKFSVDITSRKTRIKELLTEEM